jgi:hypothetical protein
VGVVAVLGQHRVHREGQGVAASLPLVLARLTKVTQVVLGILQITALAVVVALVQ